MSNGDVQQLIQAALEHHRVNRFTYAEPLYRQALTLQPTNADALHLLGILCGQTGRSAEGVQLLDQACALQPTVPILWITLGNLLRESKQMDRAIAALQRALQLAPNSAQAHNNLGNVYVDQKRYPAAIEAYRAALRHDPRMDLAYSNLGVVFRAIGQTTEAIAALRKAIELAPNSGIAHDNLGIALREDGEIDAAIVAHEQAIQLHPTAVAYSNISIALRVKGRLEDSIAACQAALKLNPQDADAWSNFGVALAEQGKVDEAIAAYRKAIELRPNFAGAWTNLGVSLGDAGQFHESLQACHKAANIDPSDPTVHFNLGVILLTVGDFKRGWEEYEWRWKCQGLYLPRPFTQPKWDGRPLDGQTIFLHADQGFGDTIQFIRYAPLVAQRGGRVILGCDPPLRRLMQNVARIESVVMDDKVPPVFHVHLPVASLPAIFATTLDTIPAEAPYIQPDSRSIEVWRKRLGPPEGRLRVGIAWAGRPSHKNDKSRSLKLVQLAPLAADAVTFYSLQKGDAAAQAMNPPPGMRLIDFTNEFLDFADTAALIAHLDLVISVDTSVAHLGGAMGKPVWTLIPFNPDWRWMLEREDSPWYPTMRLFRQRKAGDWCDAIERIAAALRERVSPPQSS